MSEFAKMTTYKKEEFLDEIKTTLFIETNYL